MTIEEKAKRYDETYKKVAIRFGSNVADEIFPELKESEDERIRKALISILKSDFEKDTTIFDISVGEIIAWLEKQGEQKPADNVKPKFHEGEWITNGDYTWQIVSVIDLDYILQSQDGNTVDDTISHVDEQFHSFTIENAKDGDVLYSPCLKLLWIYNKDGKTCYVGSNLNYNSCSIVSNKPIFIPTDVQPATKEQRDTLFVKMKEAGYTFDFEKKELKKIEQKPVWSEEDGNILNLIISHFEDGHVSTSQNRKTVNWLKSLKDKIQPKQEWSEQEQVRINRIVAYLENLNVADNDILLKDVDWLKSLRPHETKRIKL